MFHAVGNVCGADKITIDMDYESKYDTEFSEEFGLEIDMKKRINQQILVVKPLNKNRSK